MWDYVGLWGHRITTSGSRVAAVPTTRTVVPSIVLNWLVAALEGVLR